MNEEQDDPGTSERACRAASLMDEPRMAWRAIQSTYLVRHRQQLCDRNTYPDFDAGANIWPWPLWTLRLPAIVGAKIGQPTYRLLCRRRRLRHRGERLTAIGRGEWPPVTQIVFRNYQWGAEKRNSTLWFDDNFVGTELDEQVSYAGIAKPLWTGWSCCAHHGRADRCAEPTHQRSDGKRQNHVD